MTRYDESLGVVGTWDDDAAELKKVKARERLEGWALAAMWLNAIAAGAWTTLYVDRGYSFAAGVAVFHAIIALGNAVKGGKA